MEHKDIEIKSYYGVTIKNEFIDQQSNVLAVILPGQNYLNIEPLMHYSYKTMIEEGFDVLCIDYGYQISNTKFKFESEFEIVVQESLQAIKKCITEKYDKVVFIGKSIGTLIQNRLQEELQDLQSINVYLTPLNYTFNMILDFPCLIIAGTNDKFISKDILEEATGNENYELLLIDGANHSLESSNALESIENLRKVVTKLHEFIRLML